MKAGEAISSFFLWEKTVQGENKAVDLELPWITVPVIKFLNKFLRPKQKIAEFGVGGSTIFFLKKGVSLLSIEHDPKYFQEIKQKVYTKKLEKNWRGFIIPPQTKKRRNLSYANPRNYLSSENQRLDFKKYAKAIEKYSDEFFDLVLIDGRARPSCIMHSAKKIKIGGFLIIDNAERPYYFSNKIVKNILNNFKLRYEAFAPCILINYFIQTKIYQRTK